VRDQSQIGHDPDSENHCVDNHKGKRSGKASDAVCDTIRQGTPRIELPFQLGDGFDVLLNCFGDGLSAEFHTTPLEST
jgi:hypothetical protein